MHPGAGWYIVSTIAFLCAICALIGSGFVFYSLYVRVAPLLEDSRNDLQDLGDLATNTVGRAADTMELVELRVSQTMGQAAAAGKDTTRQAVGLGTVIAGIYMATRFAGVFKTHNRPAAKRRRRRWL